MAASPGGGAGRSSGGSDLRRRVVSALVLAPLVLAAVWAGGPAFGIVTGLAGFGITLEWNAMTRPPGRAAIDLVPGAGIAVAALAASLHRYELAAGILLAAVLAALAAAAVERSGPWRAGGLLYAAALALLAPILRNDPVFGIDVVFFLIAIVWAADIAAFFVGRSLRGPKLAPRISPQKTWSGLIGGLLAGTAAGTLVGLIAGAPHLGAVACLSFVLSLAGQAGDLLESAVKRRFAVKDSGTLIPGHGGLMDRLDSLVAVTTLAAFIGAARGGLDAPAQGLLAW